MHEIRRCVYIFLFEDAAKIIGAKIQRNLPDLFAFGEPASLDVREIIEKYSCNGDHLQIAGSRRVGGNDFFERRIARLETPGDIRGETGLIVLQIADDRKM